MPKETFNNLKEEKRAQFINAFLREFTLNSFDNASISKTLKSLKMAKGSFYQYFENKLDLFLYLHQSCAMTKGVYLQSIRREDYDDFWDFWRAMYRSGLSFDREHPLRSNFMYSLMDTMNSPSLKEIYTEWRSKALEAMESMILQEVEKGKFRKDVSTKKMAFMLLTTSSQLIDFLKLKMGTALDDNVMNGRPIFANCEKDLMDTLEQFISLMSSAMNEKTK